MHDEADEGVVITGVGMVTSLGLDRESTWREVSRGATRISHLRGLAGIPDDEMFGAVAQITPEHVGMLKVLPMCERSAGEALDDAGVRWNEIDFKRFGCSVSAHMGDSFGLAMATGHASDPDG